MAHIHDKIDFTVAIFVVHHSKVLLIHHRALDKWLPLGGHIELDEDPEQAALREAREESGLDVELIGERPPTSGPGTRALIAPKYLDIHRISDTHEHIGLIYWARPKAGDVTLAAAEHHAIQWCSAAELDSLVPAMNPSVKWYCLRAIEGLSKKPDIRLRVLARAPSVIPMFSRQSKKFYFLLEGLNSFSTVLYFYYFYFFMQKSFGFGNKANLVLAALNGATYALGCWGAGRLASRLGYFKALRLGFFIMACALALGSQSTSAAAHAVCMLLNVFGMCFTWPVLEALVSEGEPASAVPHMVGVYNTVWAATGSVAYFVGGAILDHLGLQAIFYVPLAIAVIQFLMTFWLQNQTDPSALPAAANHPHVVPHLGERPSPARAKTFLRMAWLANPFAYIAINTVVAVIPGVAQKLGLSTMEAGFVCSVWSFARLGAFITLWLWSGWHYRFNWLLASFVALVLSFAGILLSPTVSGVVIAELAFGGAIGLLYYSSLYYSMDASETKSEHGGIHEAVIGLGNLAGPAVGAMSLHLLPQYSNSGAWAVSALLLCGVGGLVAIWRTAKS